MRKRKEKEEERAAEVSELSGAGGDAAGVVADEEITIVVPQDTDQLQNGPDT